MMDYVFVKDSGGYVFKKLENEVYLDEKVISKKEYMKMYSKRKLLLFSRISIDK